MKQAPLNRACWRDRATAAIVFIWAALSAGLVSAQGLFDPVAVVNDQVVTRYEHEQRTRFLTLLRAPGDVGERAIETLIDERLQMQVAAEAGIEVTPEAIDAGMDEFAGRANLSREAFIQAIEQAGVAEETFRDFVRAGIAWRELVRGRFIPRTQISEAEIDRAISLSTGQGGVRVLLSEIILPADTPENAAASQARVQELSQISGLQEFASAARRFSAAPSRNQGGRIDWVPLQNLPQEVAAQVIGLPPGGITSPIQLPNAIGLFQLRALEEVAATLPDALAVDYAEFLIPGPRERARDEAARIAAQVDTCDDLYGVARGLPEERLTRQVLPLGDIPGDVAQELSRLDPGEVSATLARGNALVLLMLCGRTPDSEATIDRGQVRQRLVNQRLGTLANGYLAELRADATIVRSE